eukprot:365357-Chlamydomonas_euryale.AAC.8
MPPDRLHAACVGLPMASCQRHARDWFHAARVASCLNARGCRPAVCRALCWIRACTLSATCCGSADSGPFCRLPCSVGFGCVLCVVFAAAHRVKCELSVAACYAAC